MKNLIKYIGKTFTDNFLSPDGYFFWGWVILYVVVGAYLSFLQSKKFSFKQALNYTFPSKNFLGPSAKLDYKLFFFSSCFILYPMVFILLEPKNKFMENLMAFVVRLLPFVAHYKVPITNGVWIDALYTFLLLVIADLGWTVQHILFHRISWLWEFHKVHHSATELNIFTVTRLHPIEVLAQSWSIGVCVAIFAGVFKALFGYLPSVMMVMNASWAMVLYRIIGIYRHSHLWISFNSTFSYLVCSPAMHQIHHSVEKKHHDKNFCNVFSFWDFLFGTLYIPKTKEKLKFGIQTPPEDRRNYQSFWGCLLHPFLPNQFLNKQRKASRKTAEKKLKAS